MLEVFAVVFFTSTPFILFYIGYLLSSKRRKKLNQEPTPNNNDDDVVMLHGHNLAKWDYLGYSRCQYVGENGNITSEHPIFLFVSKKDMKRRSYHITNDYVAKNHSYVNKYVKPWAAGEGEIYHIISGEGNSPSDFLREYMLEHFSSVWDKETKWWGTNDKAKYTSVQNKQKRQNKPKVKTETEDNVVTVEFGKQA